VKQPTRNQKIQVYENLLHRLSLARLVGNTDAINKILDQADSWSYAHRSGNGALTDREQKELIKRAFWRLND
jgi:hypothetical protein